MDVITFCVALLWIMAPSMLIGYSCARAGAGLFGFIFGAQIGLLAMVRANFIPIWSLLVYIVLLTAYVFFAKR